MPSDPRRSVRITDGSFDVPPAATSVSFEDNALEPTAKILQLGKPADPPAAEPAAGIELVTVYAYGGIPLKRMIAVVDEHGAVLLHSPQAATEQEVLASWVRACEVMAEAFDEEAGTYFLKHRRLDEQGRDLPGPSS